MNSLSIWTRRDFVRIGLASAAAAGAWAAIPGTARAAGGTVNFADIGVGDPGGDWSKFTKAASGYNVNLVAIGNAPSAILNVLVAGGGTAATTSSTSSAACRSRWSTTT